MTKRHYLRTPKLPSAGTAIECVGHFDNSPNNPANPDPKAEVSYGEQTWEEMLNGFMEVVIDPGITTPELFGPARRGGTSAQALFGAMLSSKPR